jgi:hypothetical protein
MDLEYEHKLHPIENDVQDQNSPAWIKLCDYIDRLAANGREEFKPYEALGPDHYSQIHTLPASIGKLKRVKRFLMYGSSLKRIPSEIGNMESLEEFDVYTSYDLHWMPYEIMHCKKLKDSRASTRALYGNYSYRMPFPDLERNPVLYLSPTVPCSICRKEMKPGENWQMWISLWVATDVMPLLVNLCSAECQSQLPKPPEGYLPFPHRGGKGLVQPAPL